MALPNTEQVTPGSRLALLEHRSIAEQILKLLRDLPHATRILDLCCTNLDLVANLSRRTGLADYFLVADDRESFEHAKERLQDVAPDIHLFEADMLDFLWGSASDFDVILVGYALSSLELDEKRALLHLASMRLKPNGMLLVYDVFRSPGESLPDCLDSYARIVEEHWSELLDVELETVKQHVGRHAHPEELDTFCTLTEQAGLRPVPQPIWTGRNPYHKLLVAHGR